jgi:hypothetical protein
MESWWWDSVLLKVNTSPCPTTVTVAPCSYIVISWGHIEQLVDPSLLEYVFPVHNEHDDDPTLAAYLPAGQGMHSAADDEALYLPLMHRSHCGWPYLAW